MILLIIFINLFVFNNMALKDKNVFNKFNCDKPKIKLNRFYYQIYKKKTLILFPVDKDQMIKYEEE